MSFNPCFNFKLNECIGVFGYYIRGVTFFNKREREKCHEYTNMGKVATVSHVTSGSGIRQFKAAGFFFLNRVYGVLLQVFQSKFS